MATKHFTDKWVRSVKATKGQEEYFDSGFRLRGVSFGLKISPGGGRDYFIRYRNRAGKKRYYTLGSATDLALADAREKATAEKSRIDNGEDPSEQRQALKLAPTVKELGELYHTREAIRTQRPKTYLERLRLLEREVYPYIGDFKAAEVKRSDILQIIERIEVEKQAPTLAARTRGVIYSVFRYGVERELINGNPCDGLPKMKHTRARDRFLSETELVTLWKALDAVPFPLASVFRLILLTGQRPGEVTGLRWAEIENDRWIIPGERTKNKRAHLVPLSSAAQDILAKLRKHNAETKEKSRKEEKGHFDTFVFPARRGGATAWINSRFRQLREKAELEHCTPHDLRRTAATHMERVGVSKDVIGKILNHKPQDVTGKHYALYDSEKEKRAALERWAREVERITSGKRSDKIVSLRKGAAA